MRWRGRVTVMTVLVAVALLPGLASASVQLPEPRQVPGQLPEGIRAQFSQERHQLLDQRAKLAADIAKHDAACKPVDEENKALIALCQSSQADLESKYREYLTAHDKFGCRIGLAVAWHRHVVALRGWNSATQAFLSEAKGGALEAAKQAFKELSPLATGSLVWAWYHPQTAALPSAVVLAAAGTKAMEVIQAASEFYSRYRDCSFPSEDLRATCQNMVTFEQTVKRTAEALRAASDRAQHLRC